MAGFTRTDWSGYFPSLEQAVEIVEAFNERVAVLPTPGPNDTPSQKTLPVAWESLQSPAFWYALQRGIASPAEPYGGGWAYTMQRKFVQSHNANGTPRAFTDLDGDTTVVNFYGFIMKALPLWTLAAFMESISEGQATTEATQHWRRLPAGTDWPDDWEDWNDPAYSYGYIEPYDIIGPWIFADLQAALKRLIWTPAATTISWEQDEQYYGTSIDNDSGDPGDEDRDATYAEALAEAVKYWGLDSNGGTDEPCARQRSRIYSPGEPYQWYKVQGNRTRSRPSIPTGYAGTLTRDIGILIGVGDYDDDTDYDPQGDGPWLQDQWNYIETLTGVAGNQAGSYIGSTGFPTNLSGNYVSDFSGQICETGYRVTDVTAVANYARAGGFMYY